MGGTYVAHSALHSHLDGTLETRVDGQRSELGIDDNMI